MKIKVYIPGFGERFCSDNVEYKLFNRDFIINSYIFYKKGTGIIHNEYGAVYENKDEICEFYINDKQHRLNGPAFVGYNNFICFYVINMFLGESEEDFIKNLANVLIPKE